MLAFRGGRWGWSLHRCGQERPSSQSPGVRLPLGWDRDGSRGWGRGPGGLLLSSLELASPSFRVRGPQTPGAAGGGAAARGGAGMRGADAAALPHSAAASPDWPRAMTPGRARRAGPSL